MSDLDTKALDRLGRRTREFEKALAKLLPPPNPSDCDMCDAERARLDVLIREACSSVGINRNTRWLVREFMSGYHQGGHVES